ncbi:autotransporter outer membrane beta-barrel domain-containing protein [Sphingomonas sanguinis]|uniref:Autotransporter outer membrane beta-barrel domain-containing protein n=1 Tax=Sphingomonas sanguinis TaxID=33051 RepID=A0ABU5LSU7_9SPHN|nr:autotransporter outer membrane beta-barrel domain-containing protein [Sphingomonas sanguinis]MDZ7282982.1 autotransporter outer membrane beta-barrel domain-containing protein [Sphingomonas sanguinis]
MVNALSRGRQVKARALQSSAILVASLVAEPAFAQCTPDPTQANATTTCTGTDSNGLVVTTSGSTVNVAASATVTNTGAAAIAIAIPVTNSNYTYSTLTIGGKVDGGSQAGVQLTRQSLYNGYSSAQLTMTIAAGGSVSGANGIVVGQASFSSGIATASIDNSGTISGTGTGSNGYALLSTDLSFAGFSSIANRAGGTIGAIFGPVGTMTNAGTIDGGTRSAIDIGLLFGPPVYSYGWTNSGTIRANSAGSTLANVLSTSLTNSGTISNGGSGAAIMGQSLTLTNAAGGRITTAGTRAIQIDGGINLTNAGVIVGDVVSVTNLYGYGFASSTIDNSTGTITGNVRLGSGSDTLIVGYANGAIRTGITGTIDGGAGTDTLRVRFTSDATLSSALLLPTNFEKLTLAPDAKMTVTLASGFATTGVLRVAGGGTIISNATLSGTGTVLSEEYTSLGSPSITNTGNITSTGTQNGIYAVSLNYANRFENSGMITASQGGVSFSSNGAFVNSGTITATGTAVSLFGPSFANSGTIRSTGGIGVTLSGSYGSNWTNTGRIEGATAGLQLSSSLTNSGTITGTGTGVFIGSYGDLTNTAGGVITGGMRGIGTNGNFTVSGARIANAGTINGDVTFGTSSFDSYYGNNNAYYALAGGVLNGNLTLSKGDMLVAEMAGSSGDRFAGITGTVSGAQAGLRLRVRTDTTATLPTANSFATVGYELFDKAALTLTGTGASRPLTLAGQGTMDLTADIAATTGPAISVTSRIVAPGETYAANALTVTSRGALSLTASDSNSYPGAVVWLGSGDGFTNAGTITVRDTRSPVYSQIAAISGGKSVTNDGTITLDGVIGIRDAQSVTNTGRIVQAAGGRTATGISGFGSLVNTGTIEVAGTAIQLAYGYSSTGNTLDNSGRIASTGGIAITGDYGYGTTIRNLAGGTIAGASGQNAIRINGGQVVNGGTITGDVDMGYASYGGRTYSSGIYTANGGTLTGNLRFGDGNDLFVETDGQSGVTGTIDGGGGNDIYRHAFTTSATTTLGNLTALNFESEEVQAVGADTVVTVQSGAALASLGVLGDGQIVNTANVDGSITIGGSYYSFPQPQPQTVLAALTNQAVVKGGVFGQVSRFTNSGTIGDAALKQVALSIGGVGDMSFVNSGTILNDGTRRSASLSVNEGTITATNSGTIAQGFSASAGNYTYYGTTAPEVPQPLKIALTNTGTIALTSEGRSAVLLQINDQRGVGGTIQFDNSGTVTQGLNAYIGSFTPSGTPGPDAPQPSSVAVTNSGSITATGFGRGAALLAINDDRNVGGALRLDNSGTIDASGAGGVAAQLGFYATAQTGSPARTIAVTNSGTIRGNGGGLVSTGLYYPSGNWMEPVEYTATSPAGGVHIFGTGDGTATITNAASGVIEATGETSVAILATQTALDLTNAGTIRGGTGTTLDSADQFAIFNGTTYLAGAIQTTGTLDNRIVNTGTIIGSIALGAGNDWVENYGQIQGNVFLGAGDDTFLHRASATLVGTVDGGTGTDSLIIDATGGATVNGNQFLNFERFSQIGQGNVTYAGAFNFNTLSVAGGSVTVAAGQTLTSTGAVTITGTDAAETVTNNGTIAGSVALGGGDDRFVNAGLVQGAVALGDGNDSFVEGAGSSVLGGVDGGAGTNLYTALLAGDRAGLGQRSNFQQLAVTGTGTLSLTLDQSFDTVALAGTGLNVALAGNRIGAVTGTDAAEQLRVDGDIASVVLGAGNDLLALGTANAAGRYDGGTGNDTLAFTANAPVVLSGLATGFETVSLTGNALTVTGSLGSQGAPLSFGDGDLSLTVAKGGTLAGVIDLGAGNDSFRLAAGAVLLGTVTGGSGNDSATLELAGNQTLAAGMLTGFETLATEGTGALTLTGTQAYNQVNAVTDLTIAAGSSLTAGQVAFTGGNQRFTIAGTFAGAVDGGAGTDTIALSGGTATAPVAFTNVANVEALAMTGGYATVSGNAAFGSVDMTGGRLVGFAGSTMSAAQFLVRQGATFGSAGTVNGNVTVAGILSPGASPGTMTVNGNVTLGSGSLSYFELTPTVSDKLIVNGGLTIGSGSTLQIVSSGALRPGTSYDLIVASGGISGSYASILKPSDLFGFIVQRADRIQLLGQFLGDARFSPQVARSIDYANATLSKQSATSTLFAALPSLLTASGASNPRGFAQITPEAYASASQIGVDNALGLVQAARGPAFATTREDAGLFTFGQTLGQWHTLGADMAQGTSAAQTRGYGFLGGVGYGDRRWMIGAFGGWLDTRQSIAPLAASTKADGVVAGVHGRYSMPNGFGFGASIVYDGAQARTTRALPGTASAFGRYDLHSWTSDLSVHYAAELAEGWSLTPRAGLTYLRTRRAGVGETGGSPFALTVARRDLVAGFADTGVTFDRSDASDAPFRPFVTVGARYQIEGTRAVALGGYAGGGQGLVALGAARAPLVGTATGGVAYRFASGVDLYATGSAQTGRDDHQETIAAGLRLRF